MDIIVIHEPHELYSQIFIDKDLPFPYKDLLLGT